MGNLFTVPHILILLLIIVLLFGRGKISDFMGDFAKGIKSFKNGLKDDEEENDTNTTANTIEGEKVAPQKPKTIAARKTATTSTRKPRQTTAAKTATKKTATRKASTSKKKS